jgi:hypothetical protein
LSFVFINLVALAGFDTLDRNQGKLSLWFESSIGIATTAQSLTAQGYQIHAICQLNNIVSICSWAGGFSPDFSPRIGRGWASRAAEKLAIIATPCKGTS